MGLHVLVDGRTFSAAALLLVCLRAWRVSWVGRPLCVVVKWPMSTDGEGIFVLEMWWSNSTAHVNHSQTFCVLQSNFTRPMWLDAMAEIRLRPQA